VLERQQMREMSFKQRLRSLGNRLQRVPQEHATETALKHVQTPGNAFDYYREHSPRVTPQELKEMDAFFKSHPHNIEKNYTSHYGTRDPIYRHSSNPEPIDAYYRSHKTGLGGINDFLARLNMDNFDRTAYNMVHVAPSYQRPGIIAHEHAHAGRQLLGGSKQVGSFNQEQIGMIFPNAITSFATPAISPKLINKLHPYPYEYATSRVGLDRLREFYKAKGSYTPDSLTKDISTLAAAYDTYQDSVVERADGSGRTQYFAPSLRRNLGQTSGASLMLKNLARDPRTPPVSSEDYISALKINSQEYPVKNINEVSGTERRFYKDLGYTDAYHLSGAAKRKAYDAVPDYLGVKDVVKDFKPLLNIPKNISSTYSHMVTNPTDYGLPKAKLPPVPWETAKALGQLDQELRKKRNPNIDWSALPIPGNTKPPMPNHWIAPPNGKTDWNKRL
jgi:hypothetical protein